MTILQTDRLLLRPLTEDDWPAIQVLRSDPEVNRFVKRPTADSRQDALNFIGKILKAYEELASYYWVIQLKNNKDMIGSICLWNFSDEKSKAEVGYDLMTAFHKKGIMSEALKQLIDFSFNTLNIQLLEAYTQFDNIASISLLNKFGFEKQINKTDSDNPKNVIYALGSHNK